MRESFYPTWTRERLVHDEVFARAYSACPGERRAWIKKTIAQVHALAAPMADSESRVLTSHRQGFDSVRASVCLSAAVLFLDDTCTAASMAAAAAVPMLMSGVPHVCAVRVGESKPTADDVLAGLELAGLETVFHLDEAAARTFMEALVEQGDVAVLFHGQGEALAMLRTAAGYAAPPLRIWSPFAVDRVGVWADAPDDWDWEQLVCVHPCADIAVYGPLGGVELPGGCRAAGEDFDAMLEEDWPALYVPRERTQSAIRRARLVLAPGQEGCWVWPGLGTEFFRQARTALADADGARTE